MARITSNEGKEFKPLPEGWNKLRLVSCEMETQKDPFNKTDPEATRNRLIWDFYNEDDQRCRVYTGTNFKLNPKNGKVSGLTKLLVGMVPGITDEQAAELDTDTLINDEFFCNIVHAESGERVYANLGLNPKGFYDIQPWTGSAKQKRLLAEAEEERGEEDESPAPPAPSNDEFVSEVRKTAQDLVTRGHKDTKAALGYMQKHVKPNDFDGLVAFQGEVAEGKHDLQQELEFTDPFAEAAAA